MAEEKKFADLSIEDIFSELEKTAALLESGEVPLEESFSLYEKGMEMLREVTGRIDLVEKKMLKVAKDGSLTEMDSLPDRE
ncbi:MAG: exodeoxyribonuclease VII small subunit [Lachnospiraceae bacterium]|nr:exodeoxyribonuclease VII small subunit [Lachnospiraceae bacterium]